MKLADLLTADQIMDAKNTAEDAENHKAILAAYGPMISEMAQKISPVHTAKASAAMLIAFSMIDDALRQLPERQDRRRTDVVHAPCQCLHDEDHGHRGGCQRNATQILNEKENFCVDCAVEILKFLAGGRI